MLAKLPSEPPPPAPRPPGIRSGYNPPSPDDGTEFRRTWKAKYGHRWVKVGGKYYDVTTPEHLRNGKRDPFPYRRRG